MALQAYLDQMTELLLHEKLRTSQPHDEVRSVARARTLTTLRVLDGVRKATILQFLYEATLIGGSKQEKDGVPETIDLVMRLDGANLREANLSGANLFRANLIGADLRGANLFRADLERANLIDSIVTSEQLAQAYSLEGAKLPVGMAPPAPAVEVKAPKDQTRKPERRIEP